MQIFVCETKILLACALLNDSLLALLDMCFWLVRCRSSVDFSIKVAWLLGAYAVDVPKPNWKNSQGVKLKNMILNEELR